MADIAIPVVVFGVILLLALMLILIIFPKVLNEVVEGIKGFIKQLGCAICKIIPIVGAFDCWWRC
ncbi:MAG: hypothetical protein QXW01_01225 [Candidatus Aenigmatarchaeota archaeon]